MFIKGEETVALAGMDEIVDGRDAILVEIGAILVTENANLVGMEEISVGIDETLAEINEILVGIDAITAGIDAITAGIDAIIAGIEATIDILNAIQHEEEDVIAIMTVGIAIFREIRVDVTGMLEKISEEGIVLIVHAKTVETGIANMTEVVTVIEIGNDIVRVIEGGSIHLIQEGIHQSINGKMQTFPEFNSKINGVAVIRKIEIREIEELQFHLKIQKTTRKSRRKMRPRFLLCKSIQKPGRTHVSLRRHKIKTSFVRLLR